MLKQKKPLLLTFIVIILFAGNFASAALPSLVPPCASGEQTKAADLNCLLEVGANVVKLILGLSGSVVLIYFLYGGFLWLTAAGNSQKIEDGKKIVTNAVIGLVIIFSAYSFIQFVVADVLGIDFKKTTAPVPAIKK